MNKAAYDKAWQKKNKEKVAAINKRHRDKDPEATKKKLAVRKLKFLYGLTEDQYVDMLHSQGYSCKICKTPYNQLKKKLGVDHCHKTNKIRGLLCDACNRGLGLLKDSVAVLASAITYLEETSTNNSEINL